MIWHTITLSVLNIGIYCLVWFLYRKLCDSLRLREKRQSEVLSAILKKLREKPIVHFPDDDSVIYLNNKHDDNALKEEEDYE